MTTLSTDLYDLVKTTETWVVETGKDGACFEGPLPSRLPPSPTSSRDNPAGSGPTLGDVRAEIGDCMRCSLSGSRTHIVFGDGDERADLMFIGEAPGEEEDKLGKPFVGRSGQLLDKMVKAMGWSRESVYIANVLKCRPPDNRDPKPDEVAACKGFLEKQIDCVAPKVIVTLGRPATHLLLNTNASLGSLRGKFQQYRGIPTMPTFHPAYLLRSPEKKREAWSDLQKVMTLLSDAGVETK